MGSIPGFAQWVKDLALLWLWYRLAAIAPIRLQAWEPPYAMGTALKGKKKKSKRFEKNHVFSFQSLFQYLDRVP